MIKDKEVIRVGSMRVFCTLLSLIMIISTSIDAVQVGLGVEVETISQILTNETLSSVKSSVGAAAWSDFASLLNAHKGEMHQALSKLKLYFQTFGYEHLPAGSNPSDVFDNNTEAAVRLYQENFGLPVTGILDAATIAQLTKPRCGREDVVNGTSVMHLRHNHNSSNKSLTHLTGTERFQLLPGCPSWISRSNLTYAFAPSFANFRIPEPQRRSAFAMAFAVWSTVVPLSFFEISDIESADIKIDFVSGEHGDDNPFDGILGILAHAFAPEDGRFHLDSAEYWSVDVHKEASNYAIDLQSVVVHEIGHLLGLAHSSDQTAIMFPSIGPKEVRTHLTQDDIMGAQELYGARHVQNVQARQSDQSNQTVSDSPHFSIQPKSIVLLFLTHFLLYYFIADH